MTSFTVDPEIRAGYRRRSEGAKATIYQLGEALRGAREERNELISTARSRRQSGQERPQVDKNLGDLAWLTDGDLARHARLEAEVGQLNTDLQAAEIAGAYASGIGARVADHLLALEKAEYARLRAEGLEKPPLTRGTDSHVS